LKAPVIRMEDYKLTKEMRTKVVTRENLHADSHWKATPSCKEQF